MLETNLLKVGELMSKALWPMLKACVLTTIPLSLLAFILGIIVALLVALMRLSKSRVLQGIAKFYVWIIRGTPLLVQLFIIFYGLPQFGIVLSPFVSAVVGLTISQGAYNSEVIRAAINAVPKGQWEAAHALNISRAQTIRHIIIPQAALIAVPSVGNYFISLTKDTSLCAVLTVKEVFQIARAQVASNFQPLWMYVEAGIIYLILCTALTFLQSCLEKYLGKHNAVMAALNSSAKKA